MKRTARQQQLYKEYQKQYNRIKNAQRRLSKQGYVVPDYLTPDKPSTIDKFTKRMVDKLRKITPEYIQRRSGKVDFESGELVREPLAQKSRKTYQYERAPRKKSFSKETDPFFEPLEDDYDTGGQWVFEDYDTRVIEEVREQLRRFPNADGARILETWLDLVIKAYGEKATAVMLIEGQNAGIIITYDVVYKGGYAVYITDMLNYMPKAINDYDESARETLTEMMELFEDWSEPN